MTKLPFADNSSEGLWSLLSPTPPKMVSDWNLSFSSIFHVVAVVLVFVVVVLFTDWLTLQWLVCWNPAQSIELSRHYRLFWCVPGRYEADNIWHRINNSEKKINQIHLLLLFFVVPPLIIFPFVVVRIQAYSSARPRGIIIIPDRNPALATVPLIVLSSCCKTWRDVKPGPGWGG